MRPAYYKLIEECVSQIVLHKSGCDPDFSAYKRFEIDVEPLVEQLVERGKVEDAANATSSSVVLGPSLEAAITEKQEVEARLGQALQRIAELEQQVKQARPAEDALPSTTISPSSAEITLPLSGAAAPPPPPPPPPCPRDVVLSTKSMDDVTFRLLSLNPRWRTRLFLVHKSSVFFGET